MADGSEPTGEEQSRPHLFRPGQSGNPAGRPKGSRNKLGEDFIQALSADFAEHGEEVIAEVRAKKPDQYLKVVASILPKEVTVRTPLDDLDEPQLLQRARLLAEALGIALGADGDPGGPEAPSVTH